MEAEMQPTRLEDYRAPDFAIDAVELDFVLDPASTQVSASLTITPTASVSAPLVLVGDALKLAGLALDGSPLNEGAYKATPNKLELPTPPKGRFVLTIQTEIDPSANTELMGLFRSTNTYCTQCEAEGFRRITYFLDRPDVLSVYTTRIETSRGEAPVLLPTAI